MPTSITTTPAGSGTGMGMVAFLNKQLPSDFVDFETLKSYIMTRTDVPQLLKCVACDLLAQDAFYCTACTSVVCKICLGPIVTAWRCPECTASSSSSSAETLIVVTPLRAMIDAWFVGVARQIDPYSVDSDEEWASAPPPPPLPAQPLSAASASASASTQRRGPHHYQQKSVGIVGGRMNSGDSSGGVSKRQKNRKRQRQQHQQRS